MKKNSLVYILAATLLSHASICTAADAVKTTDSGSAVDNVSGIRLNYPVRLYLTIVGTAEKVCVPAEFPLRGLGVENKKVLVKLRPKTKDDFPQNESKQFVIKNGVGLETKYDSCDEDTVGGIKVVPLYSVIGKPLEVAQSDSEKYFVNSNGLTYGALVVPFKYHLGGSKDFKGSGTVGPYVGYKTQSSNWAAGVEFIGFAGLGSVQSERTEDGKQVKESLAAFSYGFGAIGRIRDKFQIGVVLGQDRVGKSSVYADNGKWWMALSVGYAFAN